MYHSFFGLRCLPFEDRPDTSFFCATPEREEVLAALEYEAHYGQGAAMVVGEAGTGKTLLLRTFAMRLHASDHVVVLTMPASGAADLLPEACKGFGVTLPASCSDARALVRLRRQLLSVARAGHRSILIVDQAENLGVEAMAQVETLTDLPVAQSGDGKLLTVILFAQPQIKNVLCRPEFSRLRQQLFGERALTALTPPETNQYIRHRLRIAGAGEVDLFDPEAVTLLHSAGRGLPRLINHLADAAMLNAYGAGQPRIRLAIVREVVQRCVTHERRATFSELGIDPHGSQAAALRGAALDAPHSAGRQDLDRKPAGWDTEDFTETVDMDGAELVSIVSASVQHTTPDDVGAGLMDAWPVESGEPEDESAPEVERLTPTEIELRTSTTKRIRCDASMESLTTETEQLVDVLSRSVACGTESAARVQSRLEKMLRDAERRAEALEARMRNSTDAADAAWDGNEQIQRLELACERADRVETGLRTFTERLADRAERVQTQLTQLLSALDGGERMQRTLQATLEQASLAGVDTQAKIDAHKNWLHDHRNQVQEQECLVTENLTALRKASKELDAALQGSRKLAADVQSSAQAETVKLRKAVEEARRFQDHDLGRAVAAHREKLEEQGQTQQRRQQQTLEDAEVRLREIADRITTAAAGQNERTKLALDESEIRLRGVAEQVSAEASAQMEKIRQSGMESGKTLREVVEAAFTDHRNRLEKMWGDLEHRQSEKSKIAEERLRKILGEVAAATASAQELSQRSLAEHQATLQAQYQQREGEWQTTVKSAEELLGTLQNDLSDLASKAKEGVSALSEARRGEMQKLKEQIAADLAAVEHALSAERTAHEEWAAGWRSTHAEMTQRTRRETEETRKQMEQIEVRRRAIESSLETLDRQSQSTTVQVSGLDQTVRSLTASVDELTHRADASRESLAALVHHGETIMGEVRESSGRIEVQRHQVIATLIDIGGGCEKLQGARELLQQCERVGEKLSSTGIEGERVFQQLKNVNTTAGSMVETGQRIMGEVEAKIAALDSHLASAANIVRVLSEANVAAHQHVEQLGERMHHSRAESGEAREVLDRLLQDVWSMTTTTEATSKGLIDVGTKSEALIARLESLIGPADDAAAVLSERMDQTVQCMTELTVNAEHAGKLADRLASITQVLDAAKDIDVSIQRTVEDAGVIQQALTTTAETVTQQCGDLQSFVSSAEGLVETAQQSQNQARSAAAEFQTQTRAAQHAASEAKALLSNLASQSESARKDVQSLQQQAAALQRTFAEATVKPAEVVSSAQAQAAQLEQVCAAVKKIFASLSQTSLQARQQTREFEGKSGEATQQLARLVAETQRASATLQQWVEEAIRVQNRLDMTLQQSPTIRETHPVESLHAVTRRLQPPSRVANPSAVGELMVLPKPSAPAPEPTVKIPKPVTRTDEIAQLIADAKRATAAIAS